MASLPSYQEATTRADWLELAAPYIHIADHHVLCLVNRHFWKVFAPRLWVDILTTVRRRGLQPDDDLAWWFDFTFVKLGNVRPSTRGLARILDLRDFARECYQFATDQNARFLRSLHMALKLLPNANALLLDHHTEIDPNSLVSLTRTHSSPLLLSISHCSTRLPSTFFTSTSLQKLVYLDVSNLPGSVAPLIQPSLLSDLRILKLAGRELDDATFIGLAELYRLRLWSLDLSHNRLTDSILQTLVERCFPLSSLRSSVHFQVEGKLSVSEHGTASYGPFEFIEESQLSGGFSSPDRLRYGVGPVSPAQVLAGVPEKSYIFHTAWRAAIMPPGELACPAPQELAGMQDVLDALKRHRATGRSLYQDLQHSRKDATLRVPPGAPHFFWTGSLEVSTKRP
ncbi:hypothetical protein LEL_05725 [Akanthomyces lecanii RCEF 1005]|uniref:Leucine Rich Repeat domain protein n=1 Tax=Akanthomyces lecanii RCEF 1005 TaxID=1081108 RepID=A0A168G5A6_CORDF|nr:hypothetical protein LEL_05725 [Akanthomyces lecanii RCEF 1005]